jgi:outer membrane receptor for ferrienterochelin and colicins
VTRAQILTEKFMGTWNVSYDFRSVNMSVDYTGNLYGPMRLPLLGELDPRREYSPAWSIQNIQFTYKGLSNLEVYGGIKNLLNWTPNRGNPFIIARAGDPFDKNVTFDNQGNAVATADNPYALTFDPSYVYGPNQGIRGFFGMRYRID